MEGVIVVLEVLPRGDDVVREEVVEALGRAEQELGVGVLPGGVRGHGHWRWVTGDGGCQQRTVTKTASAPAMERARRLTIAPSITNTAQQRRHTNSRVHKSKEPTWNQPINRLWYVANEHQK